MPQPLIYKPYIIEGFQELFATIDLIQVQVIGWPKSIQTSPLVAHIFDGFEQGGSGQIVYRDYRTIHRVYILWQDWEQAEYSAADIADRIGSAIIEQPTLFGRIATGGAAAVPNCAGGHVLLDANVRTGFTNFEDGSRYRLVEVTTTTKVKFAKLGLEG